MHFVTCWNILPFELPLKLHHLINMYLQVKNIQLKLIPKMGWFHTITWKESESDQLVH